MSFTPFSQCLYIDMGGGEMKTKFKCTKISKLSNLDFVSQIKGGGGWGKHVVRDEEMSQESSLFTL